MGGSRLSLRHRVYAIDIPGQVGASTPSDSPISTVPELLDWFGMTMATLGVESPTLIGHSYGAMIALALANSGFRTGGLILVEPNSVFAGMRAGYLARALPLVMSPSETRERRFLRWETGGRPLDPTWSEVAALGARMPTTKTVVPRRLRSVRPQVTNRAVILAEASRVHDAPRVADNVRTTWPGTRVEVVTEATHHSLPMYPPVFVDALMDTLEVIAH
ncbi:alpha/beta fold hydrolase [Gordonia aichiensis]